ncbi:MAG: hypothetical protein KJ006_03695, partial [Thermoleophilia bacterium]|nr:hypothetical protein [Thermoleophilia bacterium]
GATPMETEFGGLPVDGGTLPALIWNEVVSSWDALQAERGAGEETATVPETYVAPPTTTAPAPTTTAPAPTTTAPAPTTAPTDPAPAPTGTGGAVP